jgi:hypothetical protein
MNDIGHVANDEAVLRSLEHVRLAQQRPQRFADFGVVRHRRPLLDLGGDERPQAALGLGPRRHQLA